MKQYIALCSAGPMNDLRFTAKDDEEALRLFAADAASQPAHWSFEIHELRHVGDLPHEPV